MANINFIFGNLDKQGQLEKDDQVAADLRELLSSEETARYLNSVLSAAVPDMEGKPSEQAEANEIQPNDDAVDYMDIQEMAEDIAPKPLALAPTFFKPVPLLPVSESVAVAAPKIQGRLKFSEIFASHVASVPQVFRTKALPVVKDDGLDVAPNDVDLFKKPCPSRFSATARIEMAQENQALQKKRESILLSSAKDDSQSETIKSIQLSSVVLEHWEDRIVWDEKPSAMMTKKPLNSIGQMYRNEHLDDEEWTNAINWGDGQVVVPEFHLDDPTLLVLEEEADLIKNFDSEKFTVQLYKKRPDGKLIDRFNISEDWKSESGNNKLRIKQTHGPVKLMHSGPAVKLHPQFFKPLLPVKELRYHHRPSLKFPVNDPINFSKVKSIKKKKLREIDPGEMMRTPKDLTLKDTSKFVLVEYSEEYPPIMQNIGMASLIYNYYRKKDEKDNFVPKLTNGGPFVLEHVDVSPFFDFGDVKPGETTQVLYNNIFRAPLFPQPKPTTDFLVVKQTYKGTTKYFLREIPNTYVVGQTYPVQEVHRPQARKITQALKSRLQVVGYRMMRIDPLRRLNYPRLRAQFPMFTDLQIRQKLKEFACYHKKGENTGWWKLKPGLLLPDEDGIRKIWTPEMVCLQHSTLVGAQRLKDAGFGAEDMKELDGDEENESHLDIEVQLAPWTTTKNFIAAAQGKGMVQLFGPGDPTGCGQGFSYIRASMKEMFFHSEDNEQARNESKANHKYSIVQQQKVYKAEIERIFNNQKRALGKYMNENDRNREMEKMKSKKLEAERAEEKDRQNQIGDSNPNSPAADSPPAVNADSDGEGDGQSSVHGGNISGKTKMLIINRLIRNPDGSQEWKSEIISDPRVLNAYLRHRKLIDAAPTASSAYPNETDMKARRIRRTNAHIVKLQIKQGKRPPLNQEEDLSESELPDEAMAKPAVPNLRLAHRVDNILPDSKRRKLNSLDLNESTTARTKGDPEFELSQIIGKIFSRFIENPSYTAFVLPISPLEFPDYHAKISNPLCLKQVHERIGGFRYRSKQRFLEDINLIVNNCKQYNGDTHPLTSLANQLALQINALVQLEIESLIRWETAIIDQEVAMEQQGEAE